MKFSMKGNKGFSLVELMIVVGIIGILATMAMPKMQTFMAKAKQAEAKTTLGHAATLQEAYFVDAGGYGTFAQIGFVAPSGARYGYVMTSNDATTFVTTATSTAKLCTGAAANDVWTINQAKALSNTTPGIDCQ